jgi:hypothetical protein
LAKLKACQKLNKYQEKRKKKNTDAVEKRLGESSEYEGKGKRKEKEKKVKAERENNDKESKRKKTGERK